MTEVGTGSGTGLHCWFCVPVLVPVRNSVPASGPSP